MIKEAWLRFKRFVLPYPMAYFIKYILRLILWTCRIEIHGLPAFVECAKKSACILSLWHNRLAILPEVLNRFTQQMTFTAVVSKSRDGEPLAIVVNSYKIGKTIRVAHDNRHGALRTLIDHLKANRDILVITPDGPRGPRYEVKPGIVIAAKMSGAQIVPFGWIADKCWRMNTWDGFLLPKPFSTIQVFFGEPHLLQSGTLNENASILQQKLMDTIRE